MADTERPSDEPEREADQPSSAPESPVAPTEPSAAGPGEPAPPAEPPAASTDEPAAEQSPAEPDPSGGEPSPDEPAVPAGPADPTPAEIAAELPEPTGDAPAEPTPSESVPAAQGPADPAPGDPFVTAAPVDSGAPGASADAGDSSAATAPADTGDSSAATAPADTGAPDDPSSAAPADAPVPASAAGEDSRTARADDAPRSDAVPAVPGAHLEPDLVLEGERTAATADPYASYADDQPAEPEAATPIEDAPDGAPVIASTPLELAAGARYQATGKRKTSVARVILKPGTGVYLINGRTLDDFFPRPALLKRARQPLEATGNDARMDVVARIHGGGVSSQAGALRHGVARALVEADPNLRGELKRAGFLTRDARVKERKKAGLKKARKRPQFSKR